MPIRFNPKTGEWETRTYPYFDEWWEAFDYCREKGTPVVVEIRCEKHLQRLFPSGRAEPYPEGG